MDTNLAEVSIAHIAQLTRLAQLYIMCAWCGNGDIFFTASDAYVRGYRVVQWEQTRLTKTAGSLYILCPLCLIAGKDKDWFIVWDAK